MEEATASFKNTMASLQKKRNTTALQQKRLLTAAATTSKKYVRKSMNILGLRYKTLKKTRARKTSELEPRKRRSDAIPSRRWSPSTTEATFQGRYQMREVLRRLEALLCAER